MTSCDPGDRSSDLRAPLISAAKKSAAENEKEKLCIDDMLQKYCGEFGPWQVWHFVLTSLAWALEAFHTMVMIFADREPSWRCLDGYSGCDSNAPSVCGLTPGSWEWLGGPVSSTVAEWGLVCEEKYKVGLAQALFFGGCMIAPLLLSPHQSSHRTRRFRSHSPRLPASSSSAPHHFDYAPRLPASSSSVLISHQFDYTPRLLVLGSSSSGPLLNFCKSAALASGLWNSRLLQDININLRQ